MNELFPLYFFLAFFTFSKDNTFPYLLFCGLFLDFFIYSFPFLHTIFIVLFFFMNSCFKKPKNLWNASIRTILNTSVYLGLFMLIYQKKVWILFFSNNIYNLFFTWFFFERGKMNFHSKNISYALHKRKKSSCRS